MKTYQKALLSTVLAVTVGVTAKIKPDQLPSVLIFTVTSIERMMNDKPKMMNDKPKK